MHESQQQEAHKGPYYLIDEDCVKALERFFTQAQPTDDGARELFERTKSYLQALRNRNRDSRHDQLIKLIDAYEAEFARIKVTLHDVGVADVEANPDGTTSEIALHERVHRLAQGYQQMFDAYEAEFARIKVTLHDVGVADVEANPDGTTSEIALHERVHRLAQGYQQMWMSDELQVAVTEATDTEPRADAVASELSKHLEPLEPALEFSAQKAVAVAYAVLVFIVALCFGAAWWAK